MKRIPLLVALLAAPVFAQQPPSGAKEETLSNAQIKAAVDGHLGAVKECMKEHGQAAGKLVLVFGVLPDGHGADYKIKKASTNAKLDQCILSAFKKIIFPKRKAGPFQGVEYPFQFAPRADLTDQQIVSTVGAHVGDVKACYEEGLKANHDLKGKLVVEFTVDHDGKVISTKQQESSVNDAKTVGCILTRAKTWTFPKPSAGVGNVVFPYPFDLTPAAKPK